MFLWLPTMIPITQKKVLYPHLRYTFFIPFQTMYGILWRPNMVIKIALIPIPSPNVH